MDHPRLDALAKQLPGIISNSRAPSTVSQYSYAFSKWKTWCLDHSQMSMPADPYIIALYLTHIGNTTNTPSPINSAIAALSWAHRLANYDCDPTKSHIVSNVIDGLRRSLSKPTQKKEPITADIIGKLVSLHGADKSVTNLMNIRTLAMILISYAGFLRFNELAHIQRMHLKFYATHLIINIPKSKTDQFRQGSNVVIARTNSVTCPVFMLELYLKLVQADLYDSSSFVFRNLSKTKEGYKFRGDNLPMSYTSVRELILAALAPIVGDVSQFCVHSLRAGGASAAANAGLADRLFKRHGRWKSETAKDGYICDSLASRLSVSKNLGL